LDPLMALMAAIGRVLERWPEIKAPKLTELVATALIDRLTSWP